MGRYKRKKQRYAKQQQQQKQSDACSRSSSSSSSIQEATKRAKTFSHKDRKLLLLYLQQYYEEAYSVYHTGHRKKKRPFLESSFSSNDREEEEEEQAVLIGGQAFPNLTMDVLRKPYLALPEDLSGKQRRVVHETCIDGACVVSLEMCFSFVIQKGDNLSLFFSRAHLLLPLLLSASVLGVQLVSFIVASVYPMRIALWQFPSIGMVCRTSPTFETN